MNPQLTAVEALEMAPGWDAQECRIDSMDGGHMNRVYHVRSNGRECALRIDMDPGGIVSPDRRCEIKVMESAADDGMAPAILYSNPDAGVLVTEYLHGKVWQETDLKSDRNLDRLARLLRRVHALPLCGSKIDLVSFAERYAEHLHAHASLLDFAGICVGIVSEYPPAEQVSCCHNDVVASNVIDSGELYLIDWEYACDNDPLYDLASVISFHDLDTRQQDLLLSAYAGGVNGDLRERLAAQIRLFDAVQWLWLAMRHAVSPAREQARRLAELQMRIH